MAGYQPASVTVGTTMGGAATAGMVSDVGAGGIGGCGGCSSGAGNVPSRRRLSGEYRRPRGDVPVS